jgi:hypothetical protein
VGALLVAGCSGGEPPTERTVWVADGPPTNCISTNQLRTIRVIDDRTIDFEMTGRRAFRNTLPFRCSGLMFNTSVRHNSRTSQLCSLNTITPRSPGGGWSGQSCQLGQFQPMRRETIPVAPATPATPPPG